MPLDFSTKVSMPTHVVRREWDGESVLLNLNTEHYHGLDQVASKMLDLLEEKDSLEHTLDALVEVYQVDRDRLKTDLDEFVEEMLEHGLLEASSSNAES